MYNNAPQSGLASLIQAQGRGDDSMLVHMTPGEVQALQDLAVSAGGSLSLNPNTGLPEAGFLKELLPTIAGGFLKSVFPGLGELGAGLITAGIAGLIEGDLKKGLMAGMEAYGGAKLASATAEIGRTRLAEQAATQEALAKVGQEKVQEMTAEELGLTPQALTRDMRPVSQFGTGLTSGLRSPVMLPGVISDLGVADTAPFDFRSASPLSASPIKPQYTPYEDMLDRIQDEAKKAVAASQKDRISSKELSTGLRGLFSPGGGRQFISAMGGPEQAGAAISPILGAFQRAEQEEARKKFARSQEPNYYYVPGAFDFESGTFAPGGYFTAPGQSYTPRGGFAEGGVVFQEGGVAEDPLRQYYNSLLAPNIQSEVTAPAAQTAPPVSGAPDMAGKPFSPDYIDPIPSATTATTATTTTAATQADPMRTYYESLLTPPDTSLGDARRAETLDYLTSLNKSLKTPVTPTGGTGGTGGPGGTGNVGAKCGPGFVYDANLQRCVPVDDENEPGGPGAGDGSGGTGRAGGERGPGGGAGSGAGGGGFTGGGGGRGGAGGGGKTGGGDGTEGDTGDGEDNAGLWGTLFGGVTNVRDAATRALDYLESTGGISGTVLGLTREIWKQIQEGKLDLRQILKRTALGFVPDFIEEMFKDKDEEKEDKEKEGEEKPGGTTSKGGGEGYGGGINRSGGAGGYDWWGRGGMGGGGGGIPKGTWAGGVFDLEGRQISKASGGHIKSMRNGGPTGAMGPDYNFGFADGGLSIAEYAAGGKLLDGPGDGMSDDIKANIDGQQEARLADGEFVVPADVVSHLGNGSTKAGAQKLYAMMDRVRKARTGSTKQGREIKPNKFLPA